MTDDRSVFCRIHVQRESHGRKRLRTGAPPDDGQDPTPRVARLMALAIRFEQLILSGTITDRAELARLGYVSRARITQIMNLRLLAPDIQEALLFLPPPRSGRAPITERQLRPIAALANWNDQRRIWRKLLADRHSCDPSEAR